MVSAMSDSYLALLHASRGRWPELLLALAPELAPALDRAPRHVPCPVHGGKDGFRFFNDYQDTGGGVCNTCGYYPNGILLLEFVKDWSREKTCSAVAAALQDLPDVDEIVGQERGWELYEPDERRLAAIEDLLDESVLLDDPSAAPARRYLRKRGLSLISYPDALRFHPEIAYWHEGSQLGEFPCLLALVEDDSRVLNIQRAFLTDHGNKAPVPAPKKLMPSPAPGWTTGGAVRLYEPGTVLAITEGVETALAVHQATDLPVWAAASAHGMQQVKLPEVVGELLIWADRDRSRTGEHAARALARRYKAQGINVRVLIPPYPIPAGQSSLDWLDVLNMKPES